LVDFRDNPAHLQVGLVQDGGGAGGGGSKPMKDYRLCLESTTAKPEAPKIRLNVMVDFDKMSPVAKVMGKMIMSEGKMGPASVVDFDVSGSYDSAKGVMNLKGKGMGKDKQAYDTEAMFNLPKGKMKSGYDVKFKKADSMKWMMTKGMADVAPCVKSGANK
jgi:hypothetical protein